MKETGIIMSGSLPVAILEGRKTQTRRVITNTDVVYGLTDDRIYGILTLDDGKEDTDGGHNFIQWNPIEVNPYLAERGLHGGVGWADLLTNQIQGLWQEGIRGLVSVKRTQQWQRLPDYFNVPPESQSNKECPQTDMYGISWIAASPHFTNETFRRQPEKQFARESSLGNSGGKLDGQEGTRQGNGGRETLGIQTEQPRETSSKMGFTEGALQPTPRRKNTWDVPGFHIRYSPFQIGMKLWVKETFAYVWPKEHPEGWTDDGHGGERALEKEECNIEYKADTGNPYPGYWPPELKDDEACGRWKSSLFMPRKASRILLEITGIRAERLQSIKEADCIAEGCPSALVTLATVPMVNWYQHLWDSLNAKRGYGWDKNNWVWVIAFKRLERA